MSFLKNKEAYDDFMKLSKDNFLSFYSCYSVADYDATIQDIF